MGFDVPPTQIVKHEEKVLECGCKIVYESYNFGYSKTLGKDNTGWSENKIFCDVHGRRS